MIRPAVPFACVAVLAVSTAARPGERLALDEALARARSSPALQAAAADVDAARGRLRQARVLGANPVLAGQLARHVAPGEEQLDREVSLAQEVEVGGQRGLRVAAATHDVARAEHALADRKRRVEGEVRRSFFALAASERRQRVAAESNALLARLGEAARRRARAGDVASLEVELADVEAARAAQALAVAQSEHAVAAARLAAALGAGPDEDLTVVADDQPTAALPTEGALVAHALAMRPDLLAAREERARVDGEADAVRRHGLVPNPTLRGFYRQELLDERVAGGEISLPLPLWNREQGSEQALRAQAVALGAEADRLALDIPREVRVALTRRAAALDVWQRYRRDALPAVAAARDHLERGERAGYVALPERLLQQDRLVQAEAAAIDAWRELHVAEADLIEAVGGALP